MGDQAVTKDNKRYEPELGQMAYGQPSQDLEPSPEVEDMFSALAEMWGALFEDANPFYNTGHFYKGEYFQVDAYSWNDLVPQFWNFKCGDFGASWYKHCNRGLSVNSNPQPAQVRLMFAKCAVELLRKYKNEQRGE